LVLNVFCVLRIKRKLNNIEWRKIRLYLQVLNLFSFFSVIHIWKLFLCHNKSLQVNAKLPLCLPWRRVWVAKVYLHIFLTLALEAGKWLTLHLTVLPPPGTPWIDFPSHQPVTVLARLYNAQLQCTVIQRGHWQSHCQTKGHNSWRVQNSVYCRLVVHLDFW